MKEVIELYKNIDKMLCKNESLKKIEKKINNMQEFINLVEEDKTHIKNYIDKQINNTKIKEDNNTMKRIIKLPEKKNIKHLKNNIIENDADCIMSYKDKTNTKNNNNTLSGKELSSQTKAIELSVISKEEYEKRKNIYVDLENIKLPEQRSVEWFEMRNEKITASDAGCVVGLNKYEHQYKFIFKKVFGTTFKTNQACYHGKKLEEVVTLMYEYQNDVKVKEFGLLGHKEHNFLGASPDGICSPYKRNGKDKSNLVGRMLEIKCPLYRKIKFEGDIKNVICPIYYWCQVQVQLECCDLPECDFVQCDIEEYNSKEEWDDDKHEDNDYFSKKYGKERGILIEFLPVNLYLDKKLEKEKAKKNKIVDNTDDDTDSEDDEEEEDIYGEGYDAEGKVKMARIYDMASFKYPPKIDMTNKQMTTWIKNTTKGYKNIYEIREEQKNGTFNKDNEKDIAVHRIIYWRLRERNCTLILRDTEWFRENLSVYDQMWKYVTILRKNKEKRKEWKKIVKEKEKKFSEIKFNNYYAKSTVEKEIGNELLNEMKKIIEK
jgi:putative phage-type endonuclease